MYLCFCINEKLETEPYSIEIRTIEDAFQVREFLNKKYQDREFVIVPKKFPKISNLKLAVFDMDSTLIEEEVIDELAREAGTFSKVSEITAGAMSGKIDFDDALRRRIALIEGVPFEALENLRYRLKLKAGVCDFLSFLKSHGVKTAIISGGFTQITEPFAKGMGFDFSFANTLEVQNGKLTGKLEKNIVNVNSLRKKEIMMDLARDLKISLEEVIAIGDGANDIPMLEASGLGVVIHGKEKVKMQILTSIYKTHMGILVNLLS